MLDYLKNLADAYYRGNPVVSDADFDLLAEIYGYDSVGARDGDQKHFQKMYSLNKVYVGDKPPAYTSTWTATVATPKLDGSAISVLYVNGKLNAVTTRGDGIVGKNITPIVKDSGLVPETISIEGICFITGELVTPKTIPNARNFSAGSAGLKGAEEFKKRVHWGRLKFIAYSSEYQDAPDDYLFRMVALQKEEFCVVTQSDWNDYPQDGTVIRVTSQREYLEQGFTSKHPKGAFAIKDASDMEVKETTLLAVTWQVGQSGAVTPVAHFEPVVVEDANISKASLANAGILETLDLSIGDRILVRRAGHIIPQVIGRAP